MSKMTTADPCCCGCLQIASTMLSKYKPMLVPPRPWLSASKGGHLTLATPVVRLAAGSRQQLHALQAVDKRMLAEEGGGASQACLSAKCTLDVPKKHRSRCRCSATGR